MDHDTLYGVISYIIENGATYGAPPDNSKRPFQLVNAYFDKYEVTDWDYDGDNHSYGLTCSVDYKDVENKHLCATVDMSFAQIVFEISNMRGWNLI